MKRKLKNKKDIINKDEKEEDTKNHYVNQDEINDIDQYKRKVTIDEHHLCFSKVEVLDRIMKKSGNYNSMKKPWMLLFKENK